MVNISLANFNKDQNNFNEADFFKCDRSKRSKIYVYVDDTSIWLETQLSVISYQA